MLRYKPAIKSLSISNSGKLNKFAGNGVNGSIVNEENAESLTENIFLQGDKLHIDTEINEISAFRFSGKNIAIKCKKIPE